MGQMVLDLPLGDPQHLRQLVRRQPGAGDQVHDSLARCPFGEQHGGMVGEWTVKNQAMGCESRSRTDWLHADRHDRAGLSRKTSTLCDLMTILLY